MSRSRPRNWWPILGVLTAIALCGLLLAGATQCNGQQPQPVPVQQPQFYAMPAQGPLPWVRWQIFGRPTYDLYVPVGQPWTVTYQAVTPVASPNRGLLW